MRQDTNAPGLDLEGHPRVVLAVFPLLLDRAAFDQTRMPFWYSVLQCSASRCQSSTGAQ